MKNSFWIYIAIGLTLFSTILWCTHVKADVTHMTLPKLQRRYACYPINIRFPGWTCYTAYCSSQYSPYRVRGIACGVYVDCRRTYTNHYICRY